MPESLAHILANPRFSEADRGLITRAFGLAETAHTGQRRQSGEQYITHPLAVAGFVAEWGLDATAVAAALLHDALEDTTLTREQIAREANDTVAVLVEGLTKLYAAAHHADQTAADSEAHIESLKKMFLAMARDIRVIIIKLADRYHNLLTLKYLEPAHAQRIARESLVMYAPLAGRLGMGTLKRDMEDAAFRFAYPDDFHTLQKALRGQYEHRQRYLERLRPIIARHLSDHAIPVIEIQSRIKHLWSLWQKVKYIGAEHINQVYDLVALRIIVPDIPACYGALGVLHSHYPPLSGRIKDYIALPKPNGYQSLHTTVKAEKSQLVEIQIRTPEMHQHAEQGVAAHWAYSESGKPHDGSATVKNHSELAWINELKSIVKDLQSEDGLTYTARDFFQNRIFVFTPRGEVKDLPDGATPIDFAYAVHTTIGHQTTGAKVNGRIVSLSYALKNGDVIEILRTKNSSPSRDWLTLVKTTHARQCIRAWFKLTTAPTPRRVRVRQARRPVVARATSTTVASTPLISGHHGVLYKFGRCCNPQSGQPVCGYLTRISGVTIHARECGNIAKASADRLVEIQWA